MGSLREQIGLMRRLETARINGKPTKRNKANEGLSIKSGPKGEERSATLWVKVAGSKFSLLGDDSTLLIRLVSEPDLPESTTLNFRTVDGMLFKKGEIYVARLLESRNYRGEWLEPDFFASWKKRSSFQLKEEDLKHMFLQIIKVGGAISEGFRRGDKEFINSCFKAIGLDLLLTNTPAVKQPVSVSSENATIQI